MHQKAINCQECGKQMYCPPPPMRGVPRPTPPTPIDHICFACSNKKNKQIQARLASKLKATMKG